MTADALDPLIHVPARLRLMVTLAVNALARVALIPEGRAALDRYTAVLWQLLGTAGQAQRQ